LIPLLQKPLSLFCSLSGPCCALTGQNDGNFFASSPRRHGQVLNGFYIARGSFDSRAAEAAVALLQLERNLLRADAKAKKFFLIHHHRAESQS